MKPPFKYDLAPPGPPEQLAAWLDGLLTSNRQHASVVQVVQSLKGCLGGVHGITREVPGVPLPDHIRACRQVQQCAPAASGCRPPRLPAPHAPSP
jgi:hypothetical protein